MIKKLLLFLVLLVISCQAQKVRDTIERIDPASFKSVDDEIMPNGDHIQRYTGGGIGYIERITREDTPYGLFTRFHQNGFLLFKVKEFYGGWIGFAKYYNEKGLFIEEIDWDKDYPFGIEQVIAKIQRECGVDLIKDHKRISFGRGLDEHHYPHYTVVIYVGIGFDYDYRTVQIDGVTGETLSDISYYNEGVEDTDPPHRIKKIYVMPKKEH